MTDLGTVWGVLPATLGLVALAFYRRAWWMGSYLILTMVGTMVLTPLAKLLWHRVRPTLWQGVPLPKDFSFPSSHATYSLALVLALMLLTWGSPKFPWILGLGTWFVLFIGWSRLYLGIHYPSDILGGWLLATAWTLGLYWLMRGLFVTE
ncbi:MAG TPA: phosphatase PAP2 family protein [Leptolyngbyaceae cyanobacterium M65_K2018_010]|nr:phosphatase PAP2 family protein [Leptolyngbyaceae cyanobacterium M65_K2018_010]